MAAATKKKQRNLVTNLKKLTEVYLSSTLCKFEQISNWERRPLRHSQLHYAALDAHVLVQIYAKLDEEVSRVGYSLERHANIETIEKAQAEAAAPATSTEGDRAMAQR